MTIATTELREIRARLQAAAEAGTSPEILAPLDALDQAADTIGKAWGGSWYGYQSRVYYRDFKTPPPGAHFSSEWGLKDSFATDTQGDWVECDFDAVRAEVERRAGNPKLDAARAVADNAAQVFEGARDDVISVLEVELARRADPFLTRLRDEAKKLELVTADMYLEYLRPKGTRMSRDTLALMQGLQAPPHVAVQAQVFSLRQAPKACAALGEIAGKAAAHLDRLDRQQQRADRIGTNVFIGHGRSLVWKDLKDFIQDRLGLPWDEFNRVPVAGVTNVARLSEMLDAAAVAFLVLTAEDEQADGKMRARENVVHEAGLFQGRLGFTKAIVLLEEGCEEFTNIQGLGQIRFPKGNIKAAFEEIRRVLEREGLLET